MLNYQTDLVHRMTLADEDRESRAPAFAAPMRRGSAVAASRIPTGGFCFSPSLRADMRIRCAFWHALRIDMHDLCLRHY